MRFNVCLHAANRGKLQQTYLLREGLDEAKVYEIHCAAITTTAKAEVGWLDVSMHKALAVQLLDSCQHATGNLGHRTSSQLL